MKFFENKSHVARRSVQGQLKIGSKSLHHCEIAPSALCAEKSAKAGASVLSLLARKVKPGEFFSWLPETYYFMQPCHPMFKKCVHFRPRRPDFGQNGHEQKSDWTPIINMKQFYRKPYTMIVVIFVSISLTFYTLHLPIIRELYRYYIVSICAKRCNQTISSLILPTEHSNHQKKVLRHPTLGNFLMAMPF